MHVLISDLETLPSDLSERLAVSGLTYDLVHSAEDVTHPERYDAAFGAVIIKRLGIDTFPNLKWIQVSSAGTNHLPIDEWKAKGILITNARGVFSDPIAEWVVLYTLFFAKDVMSHLENQKAKVWKRMNNQELADKTLLVLGTGSLGEAIADRFGPFGTRRLGINTSGKPNPHFDKTYPMSVLSSVLPFSDIVVITLPLNEATRNAFDRSCIEAMKTGSILLNVGRGRIVDEDALIEALKANRLRGAVLDVMATEPVPPESPLWTTENLYLTPHDSGTGHLTAERLITLFLRNCAHFASGNPLENQL